MSKAEHERIQNFLASYEAARQNIYMELSLDEYAHTFGKSPEDYVSSQISAKGYSHHFPRVAVVNSFVEMNKKRRSRGYEAVVEAKLSTGGGGGGSSLFPDLRRKAELTGLGVRLKENHLPDSRADKENWLI